MQKELVSFSLGLLLIAPLLIIPACSTGHNQALRNELSGRGPLNLDLNNPYLAPNKFLSEETKTSETLKGFLSLKGAPEVLEFSDPLFGSTSLKLVYKSKNESYTLEERSKDWIISGPFKLDDDTDSNLPIDDRTLISSGSASPAILDLDAKSSTPAKSDATTNTTTTIPANNSKNNNNAQENSGTTSGKPTFKDIYHQVNFPGQTLSFLASWYTGNILNTERLRRINSSLSENLKAGDIVRIPSYLSQKEDAPMVGDLEKYISGN